MTSHAMWVYEITGVMMIKKVKKNLKVLKK